MRLSPNCSKEHLIITDGVGGERVLCGEFSENLENSNLQAQRGFRDLYVYYSTGSSEDLGSSSGMTGFDCFAMCVKPASSPEFPNHVGTDPVSFTNTLTVQPALTLVLDMQRHKPDSRAI